MSNNSVICWVDVESSAGTRLGHGPLRAVQSWSSTALLSKAGSFSLSLSAADPQIDLIIPKNVVRCWALVGGAKTEIGAGIIDAVRWDGERVTVSGPDLLGELRYRSVHDLELFDEVQHTPTKVVLYNGATYDALVEVWDNLYTRKDGAGLATAETIDLAASNSFLLVGYSAPFNTIYTYQGYASGSQTTPSTLGYGYSTNPPLAVGGAWPEFDAIYDDAITDGVPWAAATIGSVNPGYTVTLLQRNPIWASATYDGTAAYWIRFDPDADLGPVDIEEFIIGVRSRMVLDVGAVMAFAPGADTPGGAWYAWDANYTGAALGIFRSTAAGTMAAFSGELVLSALVKLAERSGESFRLGAGRTLEWLRSDGTAASFADAGVRATNNTGSDRQSTNPLICQIVSLEETQDTNEMVTRVYPFGAGNGKARVTLVNATLTMPAGYTLDTAANYIKRDTPDAATQIERVLSFKDIAPLDALTADTEETCNALAQAALNWLQRHSAAQRFYRLEVAGLKQLVKVGTKIRVVYRQVNDGRVTQDIDEYLIVLGATRTFAAGQMHTTSLDVGTADAWPATDAEIIADMIEQGTIYESHPQAVAATVVKP